MKRFILVVSMLSATVGMAPVLAQTTASPPSTESSDSIVQMRSQIRAANSAYKAKVHAADKVRDQHVSKARAERDKAIDAARTGSSS